MLKPRIVTIGVYGFEEEEFFAALANARVDLFCDVRRRRGVRGARYAFANSQRLQAPRRDGHSLPAPPGLSSRQ